MSNQLDLYQQVIMEHNKHPRNFRIIPLHTHHADGLNPLCGDKVAIYCKIHEGVIEDISFQGSGCAISQASASIMTTALIGKSLVEAETIFNSFQSMLHGQMPPEEMGKLKVFSGIWKYPARVKCAVLAWKAFKGAIDRQQQVSTEVEP